MKAVLITADSKIVIVGALRALQCANSAAYAIAGIRYDKEAMANCEDMDSRIDEALDEIGA